MVTELTILFFFRKLVVIMESLGLETFEYEKGVFIKGERRVYCTLKLLMISSDNKVLNSTVGKKL